MAMKIYYFTFGYGHDPGIGYYNIVYAENENEARDKMVKRLGTNKWAFVYMSAHDAGVERFSLTLWETIT